MKFKIPISICLVSILQFFSLESFAQLKVQQLYEAGKFEKCIKVCDKNIAERINKEHSYLYKSLSLIEAYTDKKILNVYEEPIYEALKCLKKIESYNIKNPHHSFYRGNIRRIKIIKEKSTEIADIFFKSGEIKSALKIYKKLFEIYPEEKVFVFKLFKTAGYEKQVVLRQINDYDLNDLYNAFYEVVSKSSEYLSVNGKEELENGLELMLKNEDCDLEIVSIMLVFLKRNYNSSIKADELAEKFQNKYWQIDMLIKVNEKRKYGYTCGDDKIGSKPPLVLDVCLTRTCQKYAELCNKKHHFSHTGPDGKSPWKRANEEGCYADGENIARGSVNVNGALNLWLNSPGHCKNIMGYHTHMGIGHSGGYWVQMFK